MLVYRPKASIKLDLKALNVKNKSASIFKTWSTFPENHPTYQSPVGIFLQGCITTVAKHFLGTVVESASGKIYGKSRCNLSIPS